MAGSRRVVLGFLQFFHVIWMTIFVTLTSTASHGLSPSSTYTSHQHHFQGKFLWSNFEICFTTVSTSLKLMSVTFTANICSVCFLTMCTTVYVQQCVVILQTLQLSLLWASNSPLFDDFWDKNQRRERKEICLPKSVEDVIRSQPWLNEREKIDCTRWCLDDT